jgi:GntR family transcriptional repressor for pyruvate dehydrogenase complex
LGIFLSELVLPKAPGLLAEKLREMIVRGQFSPGEMLPTERELGMQSGLSRGSVREALKILETEGLIEIRAGRSGGARVTTPNRDSLVRTVEVFIRTNVLSIQELLDCRIAVEPKLTALAARYSSAAQVATLRDIHEQFVASVQNPRQYRVANFKWHLAVARMSRNEILTAVMESITQPVLEATGFERITTPEHRQIAIKDHAAIIDAIEQQDEESAGRLMEAHLAPYTKIVGTLPPSF